MKKFRQKNSIGWKLITIYFLLVFIAMAIVGVFIMQQLEAYHQGVIRNNLTKTLDDEVLTRINEFDDLSQHQMEIQSIIETWDKGIQEEIFIIDNRFLIIASSNQSLIGKSSVSVLDEGIILKGLKGIEGEKDGIINAQEIPVKNMVFPIQHDKKTIGVVYLRADLTNIYNTMDQSKQIFIQAMVIALIITVLLGLLISKSITKPINEVTEKAEKMASGDFSQLVDVKSDDEIGRLAVMFNILRGKLDFTLSQISEEKNKLEVILKTMADGLIAADSKGNIIHINPAAKQMLGLGNQELEKQSYDEIVGEYCPHLMIDAIKKNEDRLEGSDIFEYQNSIFYARYALFYDQKDRGEGIVLIIQDITERQKLESMQRDFVANVSHELNTPLTTIRSYTETILDSGMIENELTKEFLTVVDSEANRMSRLVKDLLQLSRLEYQREKWNKTRVNIVEIIENVAMKMEINSINKKQRLNRLFPIDAKIMVFVDRDKIEQVFQNILSNAIKYTQESGRIDIDVIKRGNEAQVTIMDNGIGIAEKEVPRLFERFYRVDKARSRAMGGTGLGLSIAKQIVEEHEGTILIESREGKGTIVTVTIPINSIS